MHPDTHEIGQDGRAVSDIIIVSPDEDAESAPTAGAVLDPARLIDEGEIARGATSSVHRVRDLHVRRRAAMKILDAGRSDPRVRARFVREAQIVAQLDHANVAPIYDLGVDATGAPCLVMKLVRGRTLAEILDGRPARGGGELEAVLEIVLRACDAVAFAHSRGVIHRDLKPDNIMVASHGQVYVMDWGCARVLGAGELAGLPGAQPEDRVSCEAIPELDGPGFVVGTAAYMPPEQALGRTDRVGPAADVYALAATLYQAITGSPPHAGASVASCLEQARGGRVAPVADLAPEVSPALAAIVMRALAADPEDRHPSVEALAADLRRLLAGGALLGSRRYRRGSVLVREGDPADFAFIIAAGRCEVSRLEGGKKIQLREAGPGEILGETGLITSQPRTATVTALDDVTVTLLPREALASALSPDSWLGVLLRALAERFREADQLAAELRAQRPR
jgi:serine/threonine-protein kinase